MKKLFNMLNEMESRAVSFLKHGLEILLVCYIMMALYMHMGAEKSGLDLYVLYLTAREMSLYLILSFLLVICGGLFIDFAIKREKERN